MVSNNRLADLEHEVYLGSPLEVRKKDSTRSGSDDWIEEEAFGEPRIRISDSGVSIGDED